MSRLHARTLGTLVQVCLLLTLWSLLPASGVAAKQNSTNQDSACAWPAELESRDRPEMAFEEYSQLLTATPSLECAQQGILGLLPTVSPVPTSTPTPPPADAACAYAKQLGGTNPWMAWEEYERLLKESPTLECAQQGLMGLAPIVSPTPTVTPVPTSTPDPMKVATSLNRVGATEEAKQLIVEEIKNNPSVNIPTELGDLVGYSNVIPGKPLAIIGGLLGLVLSFVSRTISWMTSNLWLVALIAFGAVWYKKRSKPTEVINSQVDIAPFVSKDGDKDVSVQLTELVQVAFGRTSHASVNSNAKLISEAKAEVSADKVEVALLKASNLSTFATILELFQAKPPAPFILTGALIADENNGAGIALCLKQDDVILHADTLWQKDLLGRGTMPGTPVVAQDYLDLAEAAGIWLNYTLGKEIKNSAVSSDSQSGMTWRDWKSYALFRNASLAIAKNDTKSAIKLLHRSLQIEPSFLPARMNLITLEMQEFEKEYRQRYPTKTTEYYQRYRKQYQYLLGQLSPPSDEASVVFKAKLLFNSLAACQYERGWADQSSDPSLDEFALNSLESIEEILQLTIPHPLDSSMAHSLSLICDMAYFKFKTDETPDLETLRSEFTGSSLEPSDRAFGTQNLYTIACLCAYVAYKVSDANQKADWVDVTFDYLEKTLRLTANPTGMWERMNSDYDLELLRIEQQERFNELVPEVS